MGQFDKEIAKAKKIGNDWVKTANGFRDQFISIKKDSLKAEKDALGEVQKAIDKGLHNTSPKAAKGYEKELDTIRERLEMYMQRGKKIYDDHGKWALGDPRSSMRYIDTTLKLGGDKTEAYQAVREALKRQLTDVATAISETQKAWNDDLKFAIQTQLDRLQAIEKVLYKEKGKHSAFIEQVKKAAANYVEFCEKAYNELKTNSDVEDLVNTKAGKMEEKNETILAQKFQLYQKKEKMIDSIIAMVEKNHSRVVKSVPPEFLKGFMVAGEKTLIDKKKVETIDKLKAAKNLYGKLIKAFQEKKLA